MIFMEQNIDEETGELLSDDVLARMGNFVPSPPDDARFLYYEAAVNYCVKAMYELKAEIKGMIT